MDLARSAQPRLVRCAETLLFVDDDQPELCVSHAFGHDRASADHDVNRPVRQSRLDRLLFGRARQA